MADINQDRHHVLTLIIQRKNDIPLVRGKVKLLAEALGCGRLQMARLATAASEAARLILTRYHDGKVNIFLFRSEEAGGSAMLELLFHSNMPCIASTLQKGAWVACPEKMKELEGMAPLPSLMKVFSKMEVTGGKSNAPLTLCCRSVLSGISWDEHMLSLVKKIREELFRDTEESYIENLRAKHDEVLRLLRDKTEKNRILDQANEELLQLTNDLEDLAQERTIIEMSLKIADRIRNPSTIIGGLSRMLLKKNELSENVTVKMRQIVEQAAQIEQMVQQFGEMAKDRCDMFAQEDLVQLVRECLQSCPSVSSRGVTPVLRMDEAPVFVHANRHVLKVAIMHVLRHAVNNSVQGGRVFITVAREEQGAFFAIIDQGEVVGDSASAEQEEPPATESVGRRSGLSLVRQILSEHQAELETEILSPPDQGTRLVMHFPLVFCEFGKNHS
ncbi:MAG: hypothetical protein GQ559_07280 [Desulfobulbaceae bacterium]|nr:hypothetical protein [Desulfobulbaceae bacterium]